VAERFVGAPIVITADADPLTGSWDRSRVDQVVTNLLSNAIKFGRNKPVRVSVSRLETDRAQLKVEDEGIGITPERLPRIFERFERGVPARVYGGLGLGLFIVRAIVDAHGGSIAVESVLSEGTRVIVELPL
jgi:signal transduction histidine kinase